MIEPKVKRVKSVACGSRCRLCGLDKPAPPKPRSVMPLTHALENVRGIMIGRLDDALADLTRIALDEAGEFIPDHGTAEQLAVRFIQAAQVRLFPEEFGDSPAYTPDPNERMDVPVNPVGLVPRHPLVAVYARHLLETGKQSSAASLTMPDGSAVFSDAELARLGERISRRETGR
jgi:hypothetical protein